MPYTDFKALKERYTIEKVAELLGLTFKKTGDQLRGPCPACNAGGDRAIVITPSRGIFFCFNAREGGDLIALVAHIRKCDARHAAEWLDGGKSEQATPTAPATLQPLDLDHEHVAVEALGFTPEDAKALGIGYATKGIMRGLIAVPVRLSTGELAGYVGITEAKLPPRWHGIANNVVPLPKRA